MEKQTATVRKWGHSLAVIISKQVVKEERLQEGTEIQITVEPTRPDPRRSFGMLKRKPGASTAELLREVDKEFDPQDHSGDEQFQRERGVKYVK